ncbi:MAG: hypothetical protein SFX19_03360 [Alphaproteobacteria bacterium]|nr:hypothetical protein [Alphaproteobacteria bacterium]
MPTRNPRVNVTLDEQLHAMLAMFARAGRKTLSVAAKEMIEMGLELQEDKYFSALSERRMAKNRKLYSHEEVWK